MAEAGEILDRWGYRGVLPASPRWVGMFSQALLLNRSPRLEDLTTEAFAQLRAHPANTEHHGTMLFALQRAVSSLGHCAPPVRAGNVMTVIEGADPTWIGWVERWYDLIPLAQGPRHRPHPDGQGRTLARVGACLLYTSDADDEEDSVDLGGRRIIK